MYWQEYFFWDKANKKINREQFSKVRSSQGDRKKRDAHYVIFSYRTLFSGYSDHWIFAAKSSSLAN